MLQFMARAMRVMVSTLVEWMDAVWRNPCSERTAKSMAASTSFTRVTGMIGIICSVQTRGWSFGTFAISNTGPLLQAMPARARISDASLPIRSFSTTARFRGPCCSAKMTCSTRSSSPWLRT